ncbi:MAG: 3'(2'),5'-bisphosphate nucleotidase CysQ [Alphaproteobacteria bacterium]
MSNAPSRGLVESLIPVALNAGARIMEIYATDFTITTKADNSPVTQADQAAEAIILAGLRTLAPAIPVVSEEAAGRGEKMTVAKRFFLVDPLDGTREFINRNDEFTVNIGLIEHGVPTLGIIYAPALDQLYYAPAPGEAYQVRGAGSPARITASRPDRPPVAVASRSHRDAATNAYLKQISVSEIQSAGSSLKFCLLAAGQASLYPRFGPTCEWDTAAGHAILLQSGGGLCGLDGTKFAYGKLGAKFLNPGFLAWGAGPRPPLPIAGVRP